MIRTVLNCLLALLLLTYGVAWSADEIEDVSLKLKWQHQFQFAGYYAAIEKGFYKDAGFNVTLIEHQGGSDLYEPVISGNIEFGLADSSIVFKRLLGEPVVVVSAVFQHSPLVLISLEDSGVLSPYELIGKRVMYQQGADDASLQAMLTSVGIKPHEYELVTHNFDNFALLDDQAPVDVMSAYLSNQPFLYQERGYNVQVINPANYGIDFYGDLIYTSESYVEKNPDQVIAFKNASLRGWQYALENPQEVIGWLKDKYPSNKSQAALEYEATIISQMVSMNFVALGTVYPARFQRIASIYQQLDMAPINADISGLTLDEYVKKAQALTERTRQIIMMVLGISLIIFVVMLLGIRSLRVTIKKRTEALERQLELTDKYVISAEVNKDDEFISVSTAYCESSGYSRKEIMALKPEELAPPETRVARRKIIDGVLAGQSWQGEMRQISKQNRTLWIQLYVDPMRDSSGSIVGYTATATDITERKLVEKMSETDALTGVANRKKLDSVMSKEWARYIRYQHELSLIIFDLDHFKKINDEFGHLEGDKVLIAVADLVSESIRATDTFGRWGGEEFMVILPETSLQEAQLVAEKLREAVSQLNVLGSKSITASFGVAGVLEGITELETLIRLSDEGLYIAKENGRNRVEVVD